MDVTESQASGAPTDDHADCTDFHDREDERKWAKADALHRNALAVQALNGACHVLHLGTVVELDPATIAAMTKAVADQLLDWLVENAPSPSEVEARIDEELPALDDPHADQGGGLFAAILGGGGAAAESPSAPEPPSTKPRQDGGGVYL